MSLHLHTSPAGQAHLLARSSFYNAYKYMLCSRKDLLLNNSLIKRNIYYLSSFCAFEGVLQGAKVKVQHLPPQFKNDSIGIAHTAIGFKPNQTIVMLSSRLNK